LIEILTKVIEKTGTLALALQFYGVLDWRGDRLDLSFFFGLAYGYKLSKQ
jgi:hypothetical protein